MLGFASCLGRQQQKDLRLEDHSLNVHKHDQHVVDHQQQQQQQQQQQSEQARVEQLGSIIVSSDPQIQAAPSITTEYEISDEQKSRTKLIDEIVKLLEKEDVCKVVLQGEQGVGKTWIAKEVMKHVDLKKFFDVTIWVHLNRRKLDHTVLYKSIAHQLSIQQDHNEAEYYLDDDEEDYALDLLNVLKQKLQGKKYLLILDDENPMISEKEVTSMLDVLGSGGKKVLATRLADNDSNMMTSFDDTSGDTTSTNRRHTVIIEIKHYTLSELKDDLNRELAEEKRKQVGYCYRSYEFFKDNIRLLRCFWLSKVYLEEYGSVNYNVLILFWILEGYFDNNTSSLEKSYIQGHNDLMDLLDFGWLGEREAGDIVLEREGLNFASYLFPFLSENTPVKFPSIFHKLMADGGNVKRMNGSIAAFRRKQGQGTHWDVNLVTLLIDEINISKVYGNEKFSKKFGFQGLQILRISRVEPSLSVFSQCPSLSALILRDCHSVNNIDSLAALRGLSVLEVSETRSLKRISKDFLANFSSLESLNLSGTSIESFPRPSSSSALSKLRCIILQRCSQLKFFPDVNGLEELEVLDLSGACAKLNSIVNSFDKKVWYLDAVPKLKMLDLSETYIYDFPGLKNLKNLTFLKVKNCPNLNRIRPLMTLTKLQVIDASGSKDLRFFREVNLPSFGDCLTKLDLSNTTIHKLPPFRNAYNLIYLCLKNCHKLQQLPTIDGATNLRVLDISDATQLVKINASFREMRSLRELFLTNTKIETLPDLTGLASLWKIVLKGCKSLKSLPEMDGLNKLQLLDLQGCCIDLETMLDGKFNDVEVLGPALQKPAI